MDTVSSAARDLVPATGQTLRVLGDLITVRAVGAETGRAYALFEVCTAPRRRVPRQVQRYDDKGFLVLEGTYALQIADRTVELGPGGYAFVPRGTPHAYTNVGPGPARLLLLVSPGGVHEQFLAEVGTSVDTPGALSARDDPPGTARLALAAEKYGIELLPPRAGEGEGGAEQEGRGDRQGAAREARSPGPPPATGGGRGNRPVPEGIAPRGGISMSNATIVKDPVCGMAVDPATARHTSEYRGRRYDFCSPGCKRRFDADPERYLGEAAAAVGRSCCR